MYQNLIIALMALVNLGCDVVFKPEENPPRSATMDDAGHQWERGEHNCFVDSECPDGQRCIDRQWCYTPVEDEVIVSGEWPGDPEGEGVPPPEGGGEGEGEPPPEGEGEGEPTSEGEGPAEGEGEGTPLEGEGEGEGEGPACEPSNGGVEACDGLDNDCDGETNEDLGESSCGIGECQNTASNCVNGAPAGCVPLDPHPELCNGLDDDCDGQTDEGNPGSGADCVTGQPGACDPGTSDCVNGIIICIPRDVVPSGYSCIPPTGPDGFLMGSPEDAADVRLEELPQHPVVITRRFLMKQTEVTQREWLSTMRTTPSRFRDCGITCPVEMVSWFDAIRYANALSSAQGLEQCYVVDGEEVTWPRGLDCMGYRLPTEAEWEYAARAGSPAPRYAEPLRDVGWYDENSDGQTHPVGRKIPNAWGLYDMLGNVNEYMWDLNGPYTENETVDPMGPIQGDTRRILRSGAWNQLSPTCRAASRLPTTPQSVGGNIGIRIVRTIQ